MCVNMRALHGRGGPFAGGAWGHLPFHSAVCKRQRHRGTLCRRTTATARFFKKARAIVAPPGSGAPWPHAHARMVCPSEQVAVPIVLTCEELEVTKCEHRRRRLAGRGVVAALALVVTRTTRHAGQRVAGQTATHPGTARVSWAPYYLS